MVATVHVCITGAAGQIAYSLLYLVASGQVFGANTHVVLKLLDIAPAMEVLNGVVLELEDCALPLLKGVVATADPKVAFKDADVAILVGAMPRKQGMERKDLLKANASIFKEQGLALNEVANKNVKVLVVGNPANTNALIAKHYAPSIPAENFTALTRLDQNRASSQIAIKTGIPVEKVKNIIIWGNHSATQYPDAAHGLVDGKPAAAVVNDEAYLKNEFVKTVQQRGAAVIAARKLSSAMSAAKAIADHVHDWWHGTKPGEFVSMGVYGDGSYGVPAGLLYSYPVTIANGKWTIVQGLPISDFAREKLDLTAKELSEEKEEALTFLEASPAK